MAPSQSLVSYSLQWQHPNWKGNSYDQEEIQILKVYY